MTRKEILVFQLRECRNEIANALDGLTVEQFAEQAIPGRNPIGWIVCHCMNNFDLFLHRGHTGTFILRDVGFDAFADYGSKPPRDDNPAPDFTDLTRAADEVFRACIEVIAGLPDDAFGEKPPYWHHETFESTAGTCVRVINHSNAHLRQIWLLRGVMGAPDPWPVQTLVKDQSQAHMPFVAPSRGNG